MMTDLEIAQQVTPQPIYDIAAKLGIPSEYVEPHGYYKAKINLEALNAQNSHGKVILVTSINPTPAGEGKSTITIGLGDALNSIGHRTVMALREPSLGPIMGMKGGATGGGYAQVIPMEDINLHFTGDIHAVTAANNFIAAMIDNSLYQSNELGLNPTNILWRRCVDMNDRSLRNIVVGLGGMTQGVPREDHFDISVASEIMAILCLSTSLEDFQQRVERIVVGYNYAKEPITVKDLGCAGAVAMLMKEAIKPNLVQTLEGNAVFIHGGPFANIAHGCNSIIATNMACHYGDYVVTEAGFGADLGAEKFMDITARAARFAPSCVVIVATIRALKMHGGVQKEDLNLENLEALERGIANLEKHVENISSFQVPFVIAINKFVSDTDAEVKLLRDWASAHGYEISLADVWGKGSDGGQSLACKVVRQIEKHDGVKTFKYLYDEQLSIREKLDIIAKDIYGAHLVKYSTRALTQIKNYERLGWDKLPICVAKTQYSLSDNAKLLGRPSDFFLNVREFKPALGAGFLVAYTGDVMTMPGLPKKPAALQMDVVNGKIVGLF